MGVIQRQGIKQSIVTYIGLVIGALNTLIIYPFALEPEIYGIWLFLDKTAKFIMPFALLGVGALVIRFFPKFKNEENGHNGFLGFLFLIALIGMLFSFVIAFFAKDFIYDYYGQKSPLFKEYLFYVALLIVPYGFSYILSSYSSNAKRIVVPAIFNNLLIKISLPILALCYYYHLLSLDNMISGIVLSYFIVLAFLVWYIRYLGLLKLKIKRSFFSVPLFKEMGTYALYGVLGGIGSVVAFQIDALMVGTMVDLASLATYTIAFFLADAIDIPRKSLLGITAPIVAESWNKNDQDHIQELYQKSSLNLFIGGLALFILIWASIDDLFMIIPKGDLYASGKYVVLILGIARLVDMLTGINTQIISYSKQFRFNFYAVLCLAIFNVVSNLLLIPLFKIEGAALATLLSLFFYNLIKFSFIYHKFKMQPFTVNTIKTLLIGFFAFSLSFVVPTINPFINIILKSIIVGLTFGSLIYYFNISSDINQIINRWIKRTK